MREQEPHEPSEFEAAPAMQRRAGMWAMHLDTALMLVPKIAP